MKEQLRYLYDTKNNMPPPQNFNFVVTKFEIRPFRLQIISSERESTVLLEVLT